MSGFDFDDPYPRPTPGSGGGRRASAPAGGARSAGSNLPEFTVSEVSAAVKRTIEDQFGHVRIRGEISRPKQAGSGHLYLTLKDDRAVLEAVCWRGTRAKLALQPEEGMEVIATGRLTTYPGQSKYQLVIEQLELAGEGALLKLLEDRRKRLAAEGLFEETKKRPLPFLPDVIGVVTSPTGAVIRDILHRLADRFPRHVLVWPVRVQGETAANEVTAAIEGFNALPAGGPVPRPDVLIVARGGGSLEDLMAFNEENVVRAAAASGIPLISAVGHETDTTLIDFAADRRAPTPTAAAEIAVPVRAELRAQLLDIERRRIGAATRLIAERRMRVEGLARGLGDPARLLETQWQRLDDRAERLVRALGWGIDRGRARLSEAAARLPHPRQSLRLAVRHLDQVADRLAAAGPRRVAEQRRRYQPLADRLTPAPIRRTARDAERRLADWRERLTAAHLRRLDRDRQRLAAAGALLESYSPQAVLQRGFVLALDEDGHPLTTVAQATPGRAVRLRFHDGEAPAVVGGGAAPRRRRPDPPPKPNQGDLF